MKASSATDVRGKRAAKRAPCVSKLFSTRSGVRTLHRAGRLVLPEAKKEILLNGTLIKHDTLNLAARDFVAFFMRGNVNMVRTSFPTVAISLLTTAIVTFAALAQNSRGDHTANTRSSAGSEKEFEFEVLSIKPISRGPSLGIQKPTPNGFSAKALLYQVVIFAYGPPYPIFNPALAFVDMRKQPSWFGEPYAIDARVSQADLKAWQNQNTNYDLLRSALRAALKERCKLVLHEEREPRQIYELVVAKKGPRLKAADADATLPRGVGLEGGGVMTPIDNSLGGWTFHRATMQDLAHFLGNGLGPVRDHTGLTGRYDFPLRRVPAADEGPLLSPDSFSLDGLGLQLRRGKENMPILVIDHVERPTQN